MVYIIYDRSVTIPPYENAPLFQQPFPSVWRAVLKFHQVQLLGFLLETMGKSLSFLH